MTAKWGMSGTARVIQCHQDLSRCRVQTLDGAEYPCTYSGKYHDFVVRAFNRADKVDVQLEKAVGEEWKIMWMSRLSHE